MKIVLKEAGSPNDMLTTGSEYTVYAVYLKPSIELMVMSDTLLSAPSAVPVDDVEIIDGRMSKYWIFGDSIGGQQRIISFPEWANNVFFYQRLVEGGEAGEIWRRYKKLMDREYFDSALQIEAKKLNNGWVQCGKCCNAWLPIAGDEVVECPSCGTRQNVTRAPGPGL